MKIVMVSNYLNHHQLPLCEAFLRLGAEFSFISTEPMGETRKKLGYRDLDHSCDFVINALDSPELTEKAQAACRSCDVLIFGGNAPGFRWETKPECQVFTYSERLFKSSACSLKNVLRYCKYLPRTHYSPEAWLLCAGGYTARDYRLLGQYVGRTYKWGYFPEVKNYKTEELFAGKRPASLLWVGRFIDWKHPEIAIAMAERLRRDGIPFSLSLIGDGEMREELEAFTAEKKLENSVHFLGTMPPDEVRKHMERATVHLFTSDRGEGWGAVLNESMNSGCLVIANDEIGAAPYLISDGVNGFLYHRGNTEELYSRLREVLKDPGTYRPLAQAAYDTIHDKWNADIAAERLLALAQARAAGRDNPFADGICSKA